MKGKKFGRPRIEKPKNWDNVINLWKHGKITAAEAMKRLKLDRGLFIVELKIKEW
jgi:hypothetical protein